MMRRVNIWIACINNITTRKMTYATNSMHPRVTCQSKGSRLRLLYLMGLLLLIGYLVTSPDVRLLPTFKVVVHTLHTNESHADVISGQFPQVSEKKTTEKNSVAKLLHDILKKRPFRCRYLMEGTMLFYFLVRRMGYNFTVGNVEGDHAHSDSVCSNKIVEYWAENMPDIGKRFESSVSQARLLSSQPDTILDTLCSYQVRILRRPDITYPYSVTYEMTESPGSGSLLTGRTTRGTPAPTRWECTTGGTTFKVVTRGRTTRSFCNTLTYFNGTYLVTCPVHESSSRLSIYRMGFDFTAFSLGFPRRKLIYSGLMPAPHVNPVLHRRSGTKKCNYIGRLFNQHSGYWSRAPMEAKESWAPEKEGERWEFLVHGCPLLRITESNLKQCLEDVNYLLFLGDSHLRLTFLQTLLKTYQTSTVVPWRLLPGHLSSGQLMFRLASNARDISQDLDNLTALLGGRDIDPDKSQVLIINSGLTDLATNSLIGYVNEMETLLSHLTEFIRRHKKKYRLIWMGTVSVPDDSVETSQEMMSLNGWLYDRLAVLGVEVFDTFSMVYPFNNACLWDKHCMYIDPSDQKVKGDLGLAYTEMLLHYICN